MRASLVDPGMWILFSTGEYHQVEWIEELSDGVLVFHCYGKCKRCFYDDEVTHQESF